MAASPQLTPRDLQKLRAALPTLPEKEKRRVADLLSQYNLQLVKTNGQDSFLSFIQHVYPNYIVGPHHRQMVKIMEAVERGDKKRVICTIPPRHGKSEMISYLFPAWFLGRNPDKKIIMASHTADLAVNFGRRVRNLVGSERYKDIFPTVELQADSKSASRWGTNFGGEFFAIGVGGALAGRGADLFLADDLHNEQEAIQGRPEVFEPVYEWYQSGPVQRLMPGGRIVIVGTRWSKADIIGRVVDASVKHELADQYELIEFPAIINDKPLWPDFWSIEELLSKKASMDPRYWQAQYMCDPTSEEGALVKREWWRWWREERPPQCQFVIMSLDAAQETNNRSDYNALQTWGVFQNEEEDASQIILLNSIKQRMEFPELKELVLREYEDWEPDSFIVEKKSNGAALAQELRRMGVPLSDFTPGKGQDKIARVNAVTDMFRSGMVWVPDRRWAQDVVEECAEFPNGRNDDQVDAMTLALMRFRQGGFLRLPSDAKDEPRFFKRRRTGYY